MNPLSFYSRLDVKYYPKKLNPMQVINDESNDKPIFLMKK